MATKKKVVKVKDLKPSKDAKGGAMRDMTTRQQTSSRQQSGSQHDTSRGFSQQGSFHQ